MKVRSTEQLWGLLGNEQQVCDGTGGMNHFGDAATEMPSEPECRVFGREGLRRDESQTVLRDGLLAGV